MDNLVQVATLVGIIGYWVLVAVVSLRIALKRRPFGQSLAWLLVIFILPLLGIALYALVGELNIGRKRAERAESMFGHFNEWFRQVANTHGNRPPGMSPPARAIHDICRQQLGIPSLDGENFELLDDSLAILQRLTTDIDAAEHSVSLQFYIWQPGGLADEVAQALVRAAQRGVKVRLLLDSIGSSEFFASNWPDILQQAGVEVNEALKFYPWRFLIRRLDLRQHRKIVVIDHKIGFTGSMNLVDPRLFKQSAGVGQWVDLMLRFSGPAATTLESIHAWDWEVESGERHLPPVPEVLPADDGFAHSVQVIPSGPGLTANVIQQVLLLSIYQAKESITMCSPYFVPSEQLMEALKTAALRGVRVQIIVPDKNDSLMVEWASRSFFAELLQAGVTLHRFNGGLLHSKSVLVDGALSLIGTVNLDIRSLRLNAEVTVAVENSALSRALDTCHHNYLSQSLTVEPEHWQQRPLRQKLAEQFFYMFAPLL